MEKKQSFADTFQEQLIAISKAGAYDAIAPQVKELQEENKRLREALQAIIDTKYEAGRSRPYIETLLSIANNALTTKK